MDDSGIKLGMNLATVRHVLALACFSHFFEPSIAPEAPTLMRQILNGYQQMMGYDVDALARLSAVYREEFAARYFPIFGLRLAN